MATRVAFRSERQLRIFRLMQQYIHDLNKLVSCNDEKRLILSAVRGFAARRYTFHMLYVFLCRFVDDRVAVERLSRSFHSELLLCLRCAPRGACDACRACLSFRATDMCMKCKRVVAVCRGCEGLCRGCARKEEA